MVNLCHRTENLFDKLRNGEMHITPEVMDVILDATGIVRDMFGTLGQGLMPGDADARVLAALDAALAGEPVAAEVHHAEPAAAPAAVAEAAPAPPATDRTGTNCTRLSRRMRQPLPRARRLLPPPRLRARNPRRRRPSLPRRRPRPSPRPKPAPSKPSGGGGPVASGPQENTIRIDTVRLDMVLNLSGEIGLTKNRLTTLRTEILQGNRDTNTLRSLDEAISQLDLLVGDLQNAVMKTRMQPIGRLFQKYPRLARDLARQLGKEVELVLSGEETELDKTMIEDLNDPLVHLVRNAVDHGIESPEDRIASGKKPQALVQLTAEQVATTS
ncbi:Chemotaxis protein CheA [Chromobacterium violaceum]|uniref:Chemotaxis protein CheA n=1 Tax=Chromobacterium violaceum TaxID=536 RepID=A0A3S4IAC8_CHRVL|nr:Chemotaxis protein CheA [Chromobacterium violaceum]